MTDVKPVDTFKDAVPLLRRPFTAEAVKFKPQNVLGDGKGFACVAYIDARLVIERLNLVVPHLWFDEYEPTQRGLMWCHLTVDGIRRSDVGEGEGKGLVSDALKRAAVHFSIGVSLYSVPQQKLWANDSDLISIWQSGTKQNGKPKYDARIEDAGQTALRNRYDQWLTSHGIEAFGEPLSHGDVAGAQGDPEADDAPDPTTVAAVPESAAEINIERANGIAEAIRARGLTLKATQGLLIEAGVTVAPRTKEEATKAIMSLTAGQADEIDRLLKNINVLEAVA